MAHLMGTRITALVWSVVAIGALLKSTGSSIAASDEAAMAAHFKGKTISLLVGSDVGSSADLQGRIIAQYLGQYIPGSPRVIAQNMPGIGSVAMMNHLYNVSNRDGTAMGIVVGGLYMRHIFGGQGVRHNLGEMLPIYNPEGGGAVIFASARTGIKKPTDIMKVGKTLHFGYQSPEGNSAMLGQAGLRMLGVSYKGISGYKGSHDVTLATERGELDLGWNTPGAYKTIVRPNVLAGVIVPVFQTGVWDPKDNRINPDPDLPDVPTFNQLFKEVYGRDPNGPLWEAWFMPLISYARFTIFLPPKVPQIAVDALNKGFETACEDKKMLDEFRKAELNTKCYLKDEAKFITERSSQALPEAVKVLEDLIKN